MKNSNFIRLSGWSLMLGAVTLLLFMLGVGLQSGVSDPFGRLDAFIEYSNLAGIWVTPILLAVGMLGLRARYGDEVGSFGRNILLLGAAAPAITIIGVYATPRVDWGWVLLYAGQAVLLGCLSVFGVLALRVRPLPRWNGLPLVAGIGYPALFLISLVTVAFGGEWPENAPVVFAVVFSQIIALFLLGYILQGDVAERESALLGTS
jgi:hypothetical protein